MSWELQILEGSSLVYNDRFRKMEVVGGEWVSLRIPISSIQDAPFYRYSSRKDAQEALDLLFPNLDERLKRVVSI